MLRLAPVVLAAFLGMADAEGAATITVSNTNDSGSGSLRWAIALANSLDGPDLIKFSSSIVPATIRPVTKLPDLFDGQTTIDGDVNGDGLPDVMLEGRLCTPGIGLQLVAHPDALGCTIRNLSIVGFSSTGIRLQASHLNVIQGCHLGVVRGGMTARRNGTYDLLLHESHFNTIGGSEPEQRNVFAGGSISGAVYMRRSHYNAVAGNHFGVKRTGTAVFGDMPSGLYLGDSIGNVIGGTTPGSRNLFGGIHLVAVTLRGDSVQNQIAGNYFGLAANGNTLLPVDSLCVELTSGARNNTIGGAQAGARNVFAGDAAYGVHITRAGTRNNKLKGNYFGTNAAGTAKRALQTGVLVGFDAGPQTIGGPGAGAGNYFCCASGSTPPAVSGVIVLDEGRNTVIQHNSFGIRPDGRKLAGMRTGVDCRDTRILVLDNTFYGQTAAGIRCADSGALARAYGNTFRNCNRAVYLEEGARCQLGNLGNVPTDDEGGNYFTASNTWFIYNDTANGIKAEGNDFGTTSRAAINAKIWDGSDDGALGKVDFTPLLGGVMPSGGTDAPLALTGLSALPTEVGAQVVFSLSFAAQVEARILNIAGRPVAVICRARESDAGTNTLLWDARSDRGLPVPNGTYLIEVVARTEDGSQARALGQVSISR